MKKGLIALAIIVLLLFWVGSTFVSHRNAMVVKREAVSAAWAQVDVVLQRRSDLIPNLVETVKGFADSRRKSLRRYRCGAGCYDGRQDAAGKDRRQRPA